MDMIIYILCVIIFLISVLLFRRTQRDPGSSQRADGTPIPGPDPHAGWVGNFRQMKTDNLHLTLAEMADQFGKIFQVTLYGQKVIILNDSDLVRKAFASDTYGDVFNDRPEGFYDKYVEFQDCKRGIVLQNKVHKSLRRILHRGLKFYGEGVSHFENAEEIELKRLLKEIVDVKGEDLDLSQILKTSVANTTSCILTGEPAKSGDAEILWQYINNRNCLMDTGNSFWYEFLPFLRHLPGKLGNMYRNIINARDSLLKRYFKPAGLISAFFHLLAEENQKNSSEPMGENYIKSMLLGVAFAGTETTTTVLINGLALLVENHRVVKAIQREIDRVIGNIRMPKVSDRENMPYTMAVVYEILRYCSQNPLALPHKAVKNQNFEGYFIPKHALVFQNLWFIHHDPEIWADPWSFRPERFLDWDSHLLPPEHTLRQNVLSFSVGSRSCPGEALAKSRLFLYISSLLQVFDIVTPDNGELPDNDPRHYDSGLSIRVRPFKCKMIPRC